MNAMFVLIGALILLIVGYVFYGGWLAKQWGVDPKRPTPAQEMQDGVDYVPAKPYVLLGHHFSSIAGAGPINGPIQAAVFGWVPVLLWVIIGGIFFGAVHDFGAHFSLPCATRARQSLPLSPKTLTTLQRNSSASLHTSPWFWLLQPSLPSLLTPSQRASQIQPMLPISLTNARQ